MKNKSRLIIFLTLTIVAVTMLAGCTSADKDIISGTGTVNFIDLEGGFYGISGDDGKHYDPVNLREEFKQDSLRVKFTAKIAEDIASTHMWGVLIEIIKIEKLE